MVFPPDWFCAQESQAAFGRQRGRLLLARAMKPAEEAMKIARVKADLNLPGRRPPGRRARQARRQAADRVPTCDGRRYRGARRHLLRRPADRRAAAPRSRISAFGDRRGPSRNRRIAMKVPRRHGDLVACAPSSPGAVVPATWALWDNPPRQGLEPAGETARLRARTAGDLAAALMRGLDARGSPRPSRHPGRRGFKQ